MQLTSSDSISFISDELFRLKLDEIKTLAKKNKISLIKKVNNIQKPKTKQELINELLKK